MTIEEGLRLLGRSALGASIAEFGPVLVIFVLITLVPLTNLLFFAAGYACVSSLCQTSATDAANSSTFSEALLAVKKRSASMVDSSLGKFVKLKPVGGFEGCGVDLYIATTDMKNTNKGQIFGPNTGLPAGTTTNVAANIYQYSVKSSFGLGPCMDLSGLPFMNKIPLLGAPTTVEVATVRAAEHIDGLAAEKLGQTQPGTQPGTQP